MFASGETYKAEESINYVNSTFGIGSILEYYKNKDPNDIVKEKEHLTDEGKLPHGWEARNNDFTYHIDAEYSYLNSLHIVFSNDKNNHDLLKFLVCYMKDVMKLCDSLGECFSYWRSKKLFTDSEFIDAAGMLVYLEEGLNKEKGKL